jgi:hypothetical protein
MLRTLLIIGAATILAAACTASGGGAGSAGAPSVAAPAPSSQPAASADVSLPTEILDPIVADAAARLSVDPNAVSIVSAQAETFSDGSLGCPEKGVMYTQALVDGYHVVVEANGTQLDYRGSAPGQFRLCTNPNP